MEDSRFEFRCWDEDHFVYSTDEPGNPPKDGESWFCFEKGVLKVWVSTIETPGDVYEPPCPSAEELEEPIEQYTGLRDCKRTTEFPEGQKIFEGDIITCKMDRPTLKDKWEDTGVIVWGKYSMCFSLVDSLDRVIAKMRCAWPTHGQIRELPKGGIDGEIIGNIHANPELLK